MSTKITCFEELKLFLSKIRKKEDNYSEDEIIDALEFMVKYQDSSDKEYRVIDCYLKYTIKNFGEKIKSLTEKLDTI